MLSKVHLCFILPMLWVFYVYPSDRLKAEKEKHFLKFRAVLNDEIVIPNKPYYTSVFNDSISFDKFSFYVSSLSYAGPNKEHDLTQKAVHLISLFESENSVIPILQINALVNNVSFLLGTDSTTNVSGDYTGALDPLNDMYWSWQSGYINIKIEGESPVCNTQKNRFQLHIGGFRKPYATAMPVKICIPEPTKSDTIIINVDIEPILNRLKLSKKFQVMSPGTEAQTLAEVVSKSFKASTP